MNDLASQLRERGFKVELWEWKVCPPSLQITDSSGITFYMETYSTLEQCLERYEQKLTAFRLADNNK